MSDLDRLLQARRDWAGAPLALATVTATWGSAPRPAGSHMLVHADGRFEGSVSGGCVEGEVIHAAGEAIRDRKFRRLRYGVADAAAWEVGLPCGGEIDVMVQPIGSDGFPPDLFDAVEAARASGREAAVATDLQTGISALEREGGFVNRYLPPRRLLIVGAVQIAQALARIAATLDMDVAVIDPRERYLTAERFPDLTLDSRWPDKAVAAHRPNSETAVVTLSHDVKIDDPALIAALASEAGYVAALGSRRSHAARLERLAAAGLSADALARIDAPAGLAIGAIGPAEIALSIAAGMVQALRG